MCLKTVQSILYCCILLVVVSTVQGAGVSYRGADYCLNSACHSHDDKITYMDTLHPKKVQGPPTETETPVLTTMIDGNEVSIFDPCTEGYGTYLAPWADYFNEPNVVYTIGGYWKQRFMTQKVPADVNGAPDYNTPTQLTGNDYAVMGIQWNVREQKWQDYHRSEEHTSELQSH